MALVVEHHEALEHDLLPGIDLLDVWRGRLTFRRLEVLLRNLDVGSKTFQGIDPDAAEAGAWSVEAHLQAMQIDLFGKANFQNWEPLERPHQRVEKRHRAAMIEAALLAQRERQRLRELQRVSTGTGS